MSIFDNFKESINKHFEKKKEQREFEERLNHEAQIEKKRIFEEEFKKGALEVAKSTAKREAAEKSGLQKLRATNRARNLNTSSPEPGSFFDRMREHTQRNLANREKNLEATKEMRGTAMKLRAEKLAKIKAERAQRLSTRKPFGIR